MDTNNRRSNSGPILRSLSPCGRFNSTNNKTTSYNSTSSAFASSSIASRSSPLLNRPISVSPNRSVSVGPVQSVRFGLDQRSSSPNRSVSVWNTSRKPAGPSSTKRTCSCSPTNHPGSFRCRLHKNTAKNSNHNSGKTTSFGSNKLQRTAMANSLVRIGAVEGTDLVKRALAALIRPSSHQLRRRENFERRPSRLSVMSKAED